MLGSISLMSVCKFSFIDFIKGVWSGKRDSNPRSAWVSRAVVRTPAPPHRGPWGRSPKCPFSENKKAGNQKITGFSHERKTRL